MEAECKHYSRSSPIKSVTEVNRVLSIEVFISTFNEFNLVPELSRALVEMNFSTPTPIQNMAIPVALEGKDLIGQAQTGTGKTAAFGIPLINRLVLNPKERALVIAPTRELAIQITEVLTKLSKFTADLRPSLVIGGLGMRQQRAQMRGNPRIIVATPGRLVDHLQSKVGNLNDMSVLVMDEADRMMDMGFAPQLNQILRMLPKERQTMLFSATLPGNIQDMARKFLRTPVQLQAGEATRPVENINHEVIETVRDGKKEVLWREIKRREGTVIIFTRTKSRTEQVAFYLQQKGVTVARIHGDRGQLQRQEALSGFRNGTYRVLVATDIAARGLDVPHIAHVINYDLPQASEDFVHRIGRTARAGAKGNALSILTGEDRQQWFEIQRLMNPHAGAGVIAPVKNTPAPRRGPSGPRSGAGAPARAQKTGKVGFGFSKKRR